MFSPAVWSVVEMAECLMHIAMLMAVTLAAITYIKGRK